MQSRWIKNLVLLITVIAIAFFVLSNQETDQKETTRFPVSDLKLSSFEEVNIFFPLKNSNEF
jgi:lipopolysaccharide export system protein LptC